MKLIFKSIIIFLFCCFKIQALEFLGKFEQGAFILGKTNPDTKIKIDNKQVRVTKDGYFAFGLDRDRKNNIIIKIIEKNKTTIVEIKILDKVSSKAINVKLNIGKQYEFKNLAISLAVSSISNQTPSSITHS